MLGLQILLRVQTFQQLLPPWQRIMFALPFARILFRGCGRGKKDAKVKQTSAKDWISSRRGTYQMFYTSKIPKEFNFTREKTRKSRHFWQTIENGWRMFYSSILNELSVLQLFTQIQNHTTDFVKALLWIRQFSEKKVIFGYFLKISPEVKKYFTHMPFVTNSTSDLL